MWEIYSYKHPLVSITIAKQLAPDLAMASYRAMVDLVLFEKNMDSNHRARHLMLAEKH